MLTHEAFDFPPPNDLPRLDQLSMDSRTAIRLATLLVRVPNLFQEVAVFDAAPARRPPALGVIAGRAHVVESAHHPDRVLFLAVLDEGEDLALRSEVKAMAFFKRSCSTFRRS